MSCHHCISCDIWEKMQNIVGPQTVQLFIFCCQWCCWDEKISKGRVTRWQPERQVWSLLWMSQKFSVNQCSHLSFSQEQWHLLASLLGVAVTASCPCKEMLCLHLVSLCSLQLSFCPLKFMKWYTWEDPVQHLVGGEAPAGSSPRTNGGPHYLNPYWPPSGWRHLSHKTQEKKEGFQVSFEYTPLIYHRWWTKDWLQLIYL